MPPDRSRRRLLSALILSLLLHLVLLAGGNFSQILAGPKPLASSLEARLLPPAVIEPVLKNTLPETWTPAANRQPDTTRTGQARTAAPVEQAVVRKLAEHLFYPPEAIDRGLEGEVRLLLALDPQGTVLDARVASSSGHPLLDRAAVSAAYAMVNIPAAGERELILPVVFRLR